MKSLLPVLAAALVATTGHAAKTKVSLPPMPTTPPGSSAILLNTEKVQKELKLTSLQRALLGDIREEYRENARAISARVLAGKTSKKQGLADLQSLTASTDRRALRVLNGTQKELLDQIRWHILGGYMLLQPSWQKELALTDLQKAKIEKIWARGETYASKVNTWFEDGKISFYERLLYMRENRQDRSDDILALLTPEQYAKYEKLVGSYHEN